MLSLAFIVATFYVVGRRLTVNFEYPDVWQEFALSSTLGFGVTGSLVFLLGISNQLTRPKTLTAIVLLHVASHRVWLDTVRRLRIAVATIDWKKNAPLVLFLLVLIAPLLLLALYPPTQFDATQYHLPYAVAFVDAGSLPFLETLRFPVFPQLQEMLFVLGFFLGGDVAAQLCQFVALILSGVLLVTWGTDLVSRPVGLLSAALWLGNPLAVWLGGAAYVDIGFTLFVVAALFAWNRWLDGAHGRWLALSGAFVGFACASKYLGLFFFAVLAVATLHVVLRRNDLRSAFTFLSVFLATSGPWYLRIVLYTGNPVFPFYPSIFGPSVWSQGDLVTSASPMGDLSAFMVDKIVEIASGVGFLVLTPFYAVFAREVFHLQAPISPWYLILTPVLAYFVLRLPRGRWMALLTLAYGMFWLTTNRDIRFLLPVLPVASLALVLGFDSAIEKIRLRLPRNILFHLVAISVLIAPAWLYACYKIAEFGAPPTTTMARSTFLSRHVVGHEAIELLNKTVGSEYTVYGLFAENLRYYADGRFLGDRFGPNRFAQIGRLLPHPRRLHRILGLLNVDYLLVMNKGEAIALCQSSSFKKNFKVIDSSPDYLLVERRENSSDQ